jgi:hypothetical protein
MHPIPHLLEPARRALRARPATGGAPVSAPRAPTARSRNWRGALATLLAAALLAAGCASAPRPQRPPPLTPSAAVVPSFPVPSARERMVTLARQEWSLFGSPVTRADGNGGSRLEFAHPAGATHELQGPMLTRVLAYWYGVSRAPIVGNDGELRPWSAAFVAWIARSAGYTPAEFPPTVLHWDYIERFLVPRREDRFVTRDPVLYAPRVGDLVCNARGSPAGGPGGFAGLKRGAYHCELVVAVDAAGIDTIGGNVGDTVALTRVPVASDGRLRADPARRWAAVIEQRGP